VECLKTTELGTAQGRPAACAEVWAVAELTCICCEEEESSSVDCADEVIKSALAKLAADCDFQEHFFSGGVGMEVECSLSTSTVLDTATSDGTPCSSKSCFKTNIACCTCE
jgi:hypothetical protein